MARQNLNREKRSELLPIIARAFTELGYRRATTAELAKRCKVQENILYRLWSDKKAMFLAAIEWVYEFSEQTWLRLLDDGGTGASSAQRLLEFEAKHQGEFGHYRIIFTGLGETDDPEIADALRSMFKRFHRFLLAQILAHRKSGSKRSTPQAELTAWAVIGLGTAANIGRELGLLSDADRRRLIGEIGRVLLEGEGA
ncbi:MAG: TetR/AcrR family transcriptional regulator [Planctomycetes bacterium]|nr:TetR/AcrR family transcriptional regulator [Planctomycetota bacterium]